MRLKPMSGKRARNMPGGRRVVRGVTRRGVVVVRRRRRTNRVKNKGKNK